MVTSQFYSSDESDIRQSSSSSWSCRFEPSQFCHLLLANQQSHQNECLYYQKITRQGRISTPEGSPPIRSSHFPTESFPIRIRWNIRSFEYRRSSRSIGILAPVEQCNYRTVASYRRYYDWLISYHNQVSKGDSEVEVFQKNSTDKLRPSIYDCLCDSHWLE